LRLFFLLGSDQTSEHIRFADQALLARDRSPFWSPPIRVTILCARLRRISLSRINATQSQFGSSHGRWRETILIFQDQMFTGQFYKPLLHQQLEAFSWCLADSPIFKALHHPLFF
jgi:hypothetical protein